MKTGTAILIGLAAFAAYEFSQLNTAANTVEIVFQGIQANGVLNYTLSFMVQNVSNAQATLKAITGEVSINQTTIGNISSFTPVVIPAASQQQVNINLNLSVLGVASEIVSLVQTPGQTLKFDVVGNMNVDTLVIPFDVTNTITT